MKYRDDFVEQTIKLYKQNLNLIRDFKLSKNVENITHQNIVSYSTYSPWYDDEKFLECYKLSCNNTLVDIYRCYELWNFIKRNSQIKGDVLEVGVWKGGTGSILAKATELYSDGTVYLADTFKGVVKATDKDSIYKGGEHSDTSIQEVKSLLSKLNIKNFRILVGIFPDEINFEKNLIENIKIKLCHIDVDTYASAKDILQYIWPKIVKGGAVFFDDYGLWGCEGIKKLFKELKLEDSIFIHNINGHAIFIKL